MVSGREIRVLQDAPLDGAVNMARDEALLSRVGRHESPPTLRLYQWNQPTISLGYFQRHADYESLPVPVAGLSVVRRLTGGGAILHDLELTYSLVLPAGHPLLSDGPNELYVLAHDAVIAALESFGVTAARCGRTDDSTPTRGPFFCFERRHSYDVLIGQEKVAGSAQRRTHDALLQHGSVILGNRYAQHAAGTLRLPVAEGIKRMRAALVEHFARITGLVLADGDWSDAERSAAGALLAKYAGDEWTRRT
jgi:lipoate-protein ligase A